LKALGGRGGGDVWKSRGADGTWALFMENDKSLLYSITVVTRELSRVTSKQISTEKLQGFLVPMQNLRIPW
jgi:hypothetical protein